jgi:hypothetical protein
VNAQNHDQKQQKEEEEEGKGFTLESLDESLLFHDTLVRRVWIHNEKRPVVRITGSHQRSFVFGATALVASNFSDRVWWIQRRYLFGFPKDNPLSVSKMLFVYG